jgi:hypothetical protein
MKETKERDKDKIYTVPDAFGCISKVSKEKKREYSYYTSLTTVADAGQFTVSDYDTNKYRFYDK